MNATEIERRPYVEFTSERQAEFLEFLSKGYNVSSAARKVGINPRTARAHQQSDPIFAAMVEDHRQYGVECIEDVVRECAMNPKNFLDRAFWLKAHARLKWGDHAQSAGGQAPTINITIIAPSPAELRDIVTGECRMLPDPSTGAHNDEGDDGNDFT